jgi:two-component system, OmpR family, sensor histidine kinase VicK
MSQAPQALRSTDDVTQPDFRAMVMNSPDAVFLVAMDGRITFANPAVERIFGYTPEEFLAEPGIVDKMVHPDYRAQFERFWEDRLSGSGVPNEPTEWAWIRKDGATVHTENTLFDVVDTGGRLIGFQSVARDITRRTQTEESFAQLRQRLESILAAAAEGVYGIDLEGRTTFVNPAAVRMLGWDAEELLGRTQHSVWHHARLDGTPYPAAECPIMQASRDGQVHHVTGEVFWRRDGTPLPVEYISSPLRDQGGGVIGAVVTFRDVSDRQAFERLREEWTSLIVHDLRQPLSALQLRVEILQTLPQTRDLLTQQQLAYMETALAHFNRMINDLLDASQLEAGRLKLEQKKLHPRLAVTEIVERMHPLFHSHRIDWNGDSDEDLFVCVDPLRLEQIIGNILNNAVKYGSAESPIRVTLRREGQFVRISISNEGEPIPAVEMEALFKRFSRARGGPRKAKGLGLGLYITRALVESHGGRIEAESGGTTTTFHVYLPAQAGATSCCE